MRLARNASESVTFIIFFACNIQNTDIRISIVLKTFLRTNSRSKANKNCCNVFNNAMLGIYRTMFRESSPYFRHILGTLKIHCGHYISCKFLKFYVDSFPRNIWTRFRLNSPKRRHRRTPQSERFCSGSRRHGKHICEMQMCFKIECG